MWEYQVLVCSQDRQISFNITLHADDDYSAFQLAESMYGQGCVLSYRRQW